MSSQRVALKDFHNHFSSFIQLSSVVLGGKVISVSDEFFAEAYHLLLVEPAPSLKGQFGPNGALYSGWETRRHNPTYDWCIIRLGTSGNIHGFDIDTANFDGNEAPAVSVYALFDANLNDPTHEDSRWAEILPNTNLGPSSQHLFKIQPTPCVNFVKIHIYPDGGIARFRAYGNVSPVHPSLETPFDLAHVFAGGRVLLASDQHYGVGSNLILPGRGINMGDGWETKRSRSKGHNDWAIIQLGAPGFLEQAEIDTKNFLGNFPESCEIHGINVTGDFDWSGKAQDDSFWTLILPRTKLGPDRQHYFELENVENRVYTHVKVTIHPDGGLKRLRILGRKAEATAESESRVSAKAICGDSDCEIVNISVVPLTADAYKSYGQVIQGFNGDSIPGGLKVTPANGGTALKFHKLSLLKSSYPSEASATAGISVYRCQPLRDIKGGCTTLTVLERHSFTSQAFIPMGSGPGSSNTGDSYLVVVAHNGADDRPDMKTLRAFLASTTQGISYNPGVWHQPMTVLRGTLDLACVETQVGDGSAMDCEIIELDRGTTYVLNLN